MTASVVLSSGKCEKNDATNVSMEGYIFEGKSFPSTVYFDPNRENSVVEIQIGKLGYFDTLQPKVDADSNLIAFKGKQSTLTYKSGQEIFYKNSEHNLDIKMKRVKKTEEVNQHRKKVFGYMAYRVISNLKVRDSFSEYEFDWDTTSDAKYFIDGKFDENYTPDFLKKYQEALKNRN